MKIISLLSLFSILVVFQNCHAKEYNYSEDKKILPESIALEDTEIQKQYLSYFNKNNILKKDSRMVVFKPVIQAKINVTQSNMNILKIHVLLTNDKIDWFIPKFDVRSVDSEAKIYLINRQEHIFDVFPQWWPSQSCINNHPCPSVLYARPEGLAVYAKFNKGDKIRIDYNVPIPKSINDSIAFDIFYQDHSIPYQIFEEFSNKNNLSLPELFIKSNVVKAICKKSNKVQSEGFNCEFQGNSDIN